jgi:hypothetical protein
MTSFLKRHTLHSVIDLIQCPKPFPRPPPSAYDEILTITVGEPDVAKVFRVYRGVLCHYSEYFKTMLNGSLKERGSNELTIEDIAPEIFELFYNFFNTGMYQRARRSYSKESLMRSAEIFAELHFSADFWRRKSVVNPSFQATTT